MGFLCTKKPTERGGTNNANEGRTAELHKMLALNVFGKISGGLKCGKTIKWKSYGRPLELLLNSLELLLAMLRSVPSLCYQFILRRASPGLILQPCAF